MKRLVPIVVLLLSSLGLSTSDAVILQLKSGQVRYDVQLKTLGIGGDNVSAVNRSVIGKVSVAEDGRVEGGLVVPVIGFDSNNTKRDKDVANILKYKTYPAITFEVVDIAKGDIERILESDSGAVTIRAKIAAAGGSKVYDLVLHFHSAGTDAVRFTTQLAAKFSDFGVDPPRLGLFLKTAPDWIDLSGDLVFQVEKETQDQP